MKLQDSIRLSMRDYEAGEYEAAMLHACCAVNGIANDLYRKEYRGYDEATTGTRFVKFINSNIDIIESIAYPGSYLKGCNYCIVHTRNKIELVDFATIIYKVHRCNLCHGEEIPKGYELLVDNESSFVKFYFSKNGPVQINSKIVPALVMAVALQPVSWGKSFVAELKQTSVFCESIGEMRINDWWGRKSDYLQELQRTGYYQNVRTAIKLSINDKGKIIFTPIAKSEFPKY